MGRTFPAVRIGMGILLLGTLSCSGFQERGAANQRGLSEGAEVIRVTRAWGEEATAGDWESIQSEYVHCGLEDIESADLGREYEEVVPRAGWEQRGEEAQGVCGDDYESLLFRLANCERRSRGLDELSCDRRLVWSGRAHSRDMIERDYFSHIDQQGRTPGQRLQARGLQFQRTGENLALAPTMALLHRGWMESQGHRESILSRDFSHMGVGVIRSDLGYVSTALFSRDF